ncbi:SSY1 [[Candida] subhashii]|uniref:SSY1 n=1 Tax=[Candida] subhashii TaxID=561895 RepID=A0A8J5V4U2_9ASCO|nr:SSY1 [[Candida] subhashii]KAG7665374.1 SSY1 [[Candida] subhashii]
MSNDSPGVENDSISVVNNGLFPSLSPSAFNQANTDQALDDGYSQIATEESIEQFRTVFRRSEQTGGIPLEEIDLSLASSGDDDDSRATGADFGSSFNGNDAESVRSDSYSVDSSILNRIADDIVKDNPIPDSGRFKFLRYYERLSKERNKQAHVTTILDNMKNEGDIPLQSVPSSSSSIFNISKLDDFNKYVKETALNDSIYAKVKKKLPHTHESDHNVLNVIPESDLADNFYAGFESEQQKTRKQSRLKHYWHNKKHTASHSATRSDISGLNFETDLNSPNSDQSSTQNEKHRRFLKRGLKVRHLQMISLGGTLGVGLVLNSGKAFTIAGGFGTTLAFFLVGAIILATMVSFCEMVTFVSVVDGVSGLSSRFVDDAFGFAAGWLYFFSFAFGVAGEIVAGVIMLSYFPNLKTTSNPASTGGFVTVFLVLMVSSNLLDIRIFGEIEYILSFIKLLFTFIMMIVMVVLNRGGFGNDVLGFKYWTYSKSDFANNIIFGLFRPSFNLHDDTGTTPPDEGIGGDLGRFMSLVVAILVVCYSYSGTEIVCIAACEAQNPRKALPSATRRVFWRIIIFYCLSSFLVSLNIYAGDPRLLRYIRGAGLSQSDFANNPAIALAGGMHCNYDDGLFAGYGSGAQSPWIVALQSVGQCNFSAFVDAMLVFFAISCGNAQLYVSSRTVYSLALQGKAPKFLTYCNRYGNPYYSVLFAGSFGLLGYLCISESATSVFQNLTSIVAASVIVAWFAMCLAFVRFYFGLKRRPDILSRDDKSYPYKSPFQPYTAIGGLIGTGCIMFSMGFVVFLEGEWNTMFFFSSYGTLMAFAILYFSYRIVKGTTIPSLDRLDFDSGRTEMDRYIWDGGRDYNVRSFKDVASRWISFLA